MFRKLRPITIPALAIAAVLGSASIAVARPNIEETQLEVDVNRQVIHLRNQGGCDGVPTDRLELTIPEGVLGVIPEAVPGWTVEMDEVTTEPYELYGAELTTRVGTVRWLGSLPDGQYLDFGIAAVFREAGEFVLPVLQACGETEILWDAIVPEDVEPSEVDRRAPTLVVTEEIEDVDVVALQEAVTAIEKALADMRTEAGDLRVPALRDQVDRLEARLDALDGGGPEESPAP